MASWASWRSAGFGPSAFSTYGTWKVVTPELDPYVKNMAGGQRLGFVASKSRGSDEWRRFAWMIYDLRLDANLPYGIRLFTGILKLWGYGRPGVLTRKGGDVCPRDIQDRCGVTALPGLESWLCREL